MALRLNTISFDCDDRQGLAAFWAAALDGTVETDADGDVLVHPAHGPALLFGEDAGPKVVKNRLHFDLDSDDRDAEVARLLGLGATHVDIGQGDDVSWVVLADPEGNEFCVLAST